MIGSRSNGAALRAMVLGLAAVAGAVSASAATPVELRRTADGTPHIKAVDMRGAGLGTGYAQAEDALCTLADAYVTFSGWRAYAFGADGRPDYNATYTGATNLELDVFFRAFLGPGPLARFKAAQPSAIRQLVEGYAQGYNRYLARVRAAPRAVDEPVCLREPWVRPIGTDDVYRRIQATSLAAGYARFVSEIVNAAPPRGAGPVAVGSMSTWMASPVEAWHVGGQAGLGSNVLAFGEDADMQAGVRSSALLFGNPHWFWGGPDRFYQMHISVPGKLDVAGAGFLGVPLPMIGYTDRVAWSHTVSAARRFGLHVLNLQKGDPLRYRVDGRTESIRAQVVDVPLRGARGQTRSVRRTVYRSGLGAIVNLAGKAPQLGWTGESAIALRDINQDNHHVLSTYLAWAQARSLDQFVAIARRDLAMPWVNTVAIGRGDTRAWYGDVGAVPNVPDALRAACVTPFSPLVARWDPAIPVLDGSRASCSWPVDPATPLPGQMPVERLPARFRTDYVANMNDSYWLASDAQPLEGYDAVLGGERQPLSLRARHGHAIAHQAREQARGDVERLARFLENETLAARDYAAVEFKPALLEAACASPPDASLAEPCAVLSRWGSTAGADDQGAWLWSAFWQAIQMSEASKAGTLYARSFDAADPLNTPAGIRLEPAEARAALASAVSKLHEQGVALEATVAAYLKVPSTDGPIPLYGGCGSGYFTIACPAEPGGGMDGRAHGNTYLQIVRFGDDGVLARTLLASGVRETAWSGGPGSDVIRRYAQRQWTTAPWRTEEIEAAQISLRLLSPPQ